MNFLSIITLVSFVLLDDEYFLRRRKWKHRFIHEREISNSNKQSMVYITIAYNNLIIEYCFLLQIHESIQFWNRYYLVVEQCLLMVITWIFIIVSKVGIHMLHMVKNNKLPIGTNPTFSQIANKRNVLLHNYWYQTLLIITLILSQPRSIKTAFVNGL
jgi:hypothetical protein